METKTKSKSKSLKSNSLGLIRNKSQFSKAGSQLTLLTTHREHPKPKNGSAKNKLPARGKANR